MGSSGSISASSHIRRWPNDVGNSYTATVSLPGSGASGHRHQAQLGGVALAPGVGQPRLVRRGQHLDDGHRRVGPGVPAGTAQRPGDQVDRGEAGQVGVDRLALAGEPDEHVPGQSVSRRPRPGLQVAGALVGGVGERDIGGGSAHRSRLDHEVVDGDARHVRARWHQVEAVADRTADQVAENLEQVDARTSRRGAAPAARWASRPRRSRRPRAWWPGRSRTSRARRRAAGRPARPARWTAACGRRRSRRSRPSTRPGRPGRAAWRRGRRPGRRGTPTRRRSARLTMLGWTSPSTQVSGPPAPASAPAIIRSGLWCTAIGQGSGWAGKLRGRPAPAGRPPAAEPGRVDAGGRQVEDRRPALPQCVHRGLDEPRRLAEQRLVDDQPEVGERHDVGAERGGPLPVGLLEVPRVHRAAGRGEPPGAVEHQGQGRASSVYGVRAEPHRAAAQALLVDERAAGVELARPSGGRDAGQPGEGRLQAGHGRGHPLRVAAGRGQLVPGRGQLVQGLLAPARGRRRR